MKLHEAETEKFNIKQMKDLFEQKAAQLATEIVGKGTWEFAFFLLSSMEIVWNGNCMELLFWRVSNVFYSRYQVTLWWGEEPERGGWAESEQPAAGPAERETGKRQTADRTGNLPLTLTHSLTYKHTHFHITYNFLPWLIKLFINPHVKKCLHPKIHRPDIESNHFLTVMSAECIFLELFRHSWTHFEESAICLQEFRDTKVIFS